MVTTILLGSWISLLSVWVMLVVTALIFPSMRGKFLENAIHQLLIIIMFLAVVMSIPYVAEYYYET